MLTAIKRAKKSYGILKNNHKKYFLIKATNTYEIQIPCNNVFYGKYEHI